MSTMRQYNIRKQAVMPFLLAYFIFAVAFKPAGETEVFPFFRWSLFSVTNPNSSDNAIYITSLNGERLEEPTNFYDLPDKFEAARLHEPMFFKAVDRLMFAAQEGDQEFTERYRRLIERNYFRKYNDVEYELAVVRFDPVERFETGAIR